MYVYMCKRNKTKQHSSAKPWQVAKALLEHRIVLDAILIGEGNTNSQLIALVKASNGYAFAPETIVQALELCELETLLSMNERPVIAENAWRKPGSQQVLRYVHVHNAYIYIYIYIHTGIHIHMYVYKHAYTHTQMQTHTKTQTQTHTHTHVCLLVCACGREIQMCEILKRNRQWTRCLSCSAKPQSWKMLGLELLPLVASLLSYPHGLSCSLAMSLPLFSL